MYEPVLSIDLGASYTKLAIRENAIPDRMGERSTTPRLLAVDGDILIPSLGMESRASESEWFFGADAAKMNPSGRILHRNWKAQLFKETLDEDCISAAFVAREFMSWLRKRLLDAGIDPTRYEVRVALPAFNVSDRVGRVIARCMELAGWRSPRISKTTEPHANAIGLFSRGDNVVARNRDGEFLLNFARMFGHNNVYIARARTGVLHGAGQSLVKIAIVDIGAFTTDISLVTFDTRASGGPLDDGWAGIEEESHRLGVIGAMDEPVLAELSGRHGFTSSLLSFDTTERIKQNLYKHEPYDLVLEGRGVVTLGDKEDEAIVERHASSFAEGVAVHATRMLAESRPDHVFLTGGGALIDVLSRHLTTCLHRDLSISPDHVIRELVSHAPSDVATDADEKLFEWRASGIGLHRLATALGGASVILQARKQDGPRPVAPIPSPTRAAVRLRDETTCLCRGLNPDCCFCGGTGMRRSP